MGQAKRDGEVLLRIQGSAEERGRSTGSISRTIAETSSSSNDSTSDSDRMLDGGISFRDW